MTTLERVKEKLKECLQEVRDYRALRVIEETIVEVHNILAEAPSAVQPPATVKTSIETASAVAKAVPDDEPLADVPDADKARVA
jgi:hypothetical protein